jgi:gamma-glutamyltranspeptidase
MTSGLHAIERRPDGSLAGGADPRREGRALGG